MFILFNRSIPLTENDDLYYTSSMFLVSNAAECEGQVRNGQQLAGMTRGCSILTVIDFLCLGFARIQQRAERILKHLYTSYAQAERPTKTFRRGGDVEPMCDTRSRDVIPPTAS